MFRRVAEQISILERRPEPWTRGALVDVLHLKSNPWYSRRSQIVSLIGQLKPAVSESNPVLQSRCVGDPEQFKRVAKALLEYLQGGGRSRLLLPAFPSRATRPSSREDADSLFTSVTVGGVPATSDESVSSFVTWANARPFWPSLTPHGPKGPTSRRKTPLRSGWRGMRLKLTNLTRSSPWPMTSDY